jgi:hypothetical protein
MPSAPPVGEIEHRTGATDVVLRFGYGGGFVPIEYLASQAPGFTLFGTGVVVFQRAATAGAQQLENGAVRGDPWRTAKLDEGQVQGLLAFALEQGGLGIARESYPSTGVADAGDTIFTIQPAASTRRSPSTRSESRTSPSPTRRRARHSIGWPGDSETSTKGGSIGSDVYQPDRYRGILTARDVPGPGAIAWPWPALKRTDFVAGANGSGEPVVPHRAMSLDEVAALKLIGIEGGVQGLSLVGPDGKAYTLALRPLLVDELA